MTLIRRLFRLIFAAGVLLVQAAVWMASRRTARAFMIRSPLAIDGDTLFSDGMKIRIFGIDAPEMDQPGGEEAKRKMAEMVKGRRIRVESVETDAYGRTVARVYAGASDLGAAMVAGGYALARCAPYRPAEARARRKSLGLWRNGGIEDPAAWRRRTT
jgi:micrococcal nuclease